MASQEQSSSSVSPRWHKNYTRLMPYYYVNKKAKLIFFGKDKVEKVEKVVRVRKIIKSTKELVIEVAEKIDKKKGKTKVKGKKRKRLIESTLTTTWDELEEISYQLIKASRWSLSFIR